MSSVNEIAKAVHANIAVELAKVEIPEELKISDELVNQFVGVGVRATIDTLTKDESNIMIYIDHEEDGKIEDFNEEAFYTAFFGSVNT